MKNLLIGMLTLWALLLAPGLCIGGVVEHACNDCSEVSCSHEQQCPDDPCKESIVQTAARGLDLDIAAVADLAPNFLAPGETSLAQRLYPETSLPTINNPRYASDLPLLI